MQAHVCIVYYIVFACVLASCVCQVADYWAVGLERLLLNILNLAGLPAEPDFALLVIFVVFGLTKIGHSGVSFV